MASGSPPVFHDPTGRRGRTFTRVVAAVLGLLALITSVFALSLILGPFLPKLAPATPPIGVHVSGRAKRLDRYLLRREREKLWSDIAKTNARLDRLDRLD